MMQLDSVYLSFRLFSLLAANKNGVILRTPWSFEVRMSIPLRKTRRRYPQICTDSHLVVPAKAGFQVFHHGDTEVTEPKKDERSTLGSLSLSGEFSPHTTAQPVRDEYRRQKAPPGRECAVCYPDDCLTGSTDMKLLRTVVSVRAASLSNYVRVGGQHVYRRSEGRGSADAAYLL